MKRGIVIGCIIAILALVSSAQAAVSNNVQFAVTLLTGNNSFSQLTPTTSPAPFPLPTLTFTLVICSSPCPAPTVVNLGQQLFLSTGNYTVTATGSFAFPTNTCALNYPNCGYFVLQGLNAPYWCTTSNPTCTVSNGATVSIPNQPQAYTIITAYYANPAALPPPSLCRPYVGLDCYQTGAIVGVAASAVFAGLFFTMPARRKH